MRPPSKSAVIASLSVCYSIGLWPQSSAEMENQPLKHRPLCSPAIREHLCQLHGVLTKKKRAIKKLPTISLYGRHEAKAVEMLRCTYHVVKEACERNCGNVEEIPAEKQTEKTWSCLSLVPLTAKAVGLIASSFNLSEEYVGAESTTSPSCYFVTTLQNT